MPEQLTADDFRERIDQAFRLRHEQLTDVDATLLEVDDLTAGSDRTGRAPFSLLFAVGGDAEPVQALFDVEHETLGRLQVFLVPIGRDERGLLLEAVFN